MANTVESSLDVLIVFAYQSRMELLRTLPLPLLDFSDVFWSAFDVYDYASSDAEINMI